jgi:hypothetical protein
MIKVLMKLGIERMYLNITKATMDKPITNITLHGEKLKPFPIKSGMSTFSTLIQHSLGMPSQSSKTRRNSTSKSQTTPI